MTELDHPSDTVAGTPVPEPASAPAARPGALIAGGLLGVALLAACGVLIRELLAAAGIIDGEVWIRRAAHSLASQTWADWMWALPAAGILAGLIALWLLLKPRHRTHLGFGDDPDIWTRRVDVARRISAAVLMLPEIREAVTTVRRRRITVAVTAVGAVDVDRVKATVADAAESSRVPSSIIVKVSS